MKTTIATIGLLLCAVLSAQTGAITGQITDQTQAAVPNAQIVVKSLETGIQYRATTRAKGSPRVYQVLSSVPRLPAYATCLICTALDQSTRDSQTSLP